MSWSVVYSRASTGVSAALVSVEVHLSRGLPSFCMVGLPEKAVKESRFRVRSALLNCGFHFPIKRIVVNLAPADLPKEGGRFDLPMAIGILLASGQLPKQSAEGLEFAGELELSGKLRAVKGMLPFAVATQQAGHSLILPKHNAAETALLPQLTTYTAEHLLEVHEHLCGKTQLPIHPCQPSQPKAPAYLDLVDVIGQHFARRALEVAAAGAHSLLLSGPPGSGKTLLASRLTSILPAMQESEALEVATLYSISQHGFSPDNWGIRPFRSPHHSASDRALVGGGNPPQPGEISLAHHGVLFLDELPEFPRHALEALREPLEAGKITISRAAHQVEFYAKFQLIAAMNPCPCGYASTLSDRCRCSPDQVRRYQMRLSGPLLDRIDMHVNVLPLSTAMLLNQKNQAESSAIVQARVCAARLQQQARCNKPNAWLNPAETLQYCHWLETDRDFFTRAVNKFSLSARAYHRILKLSRTIADLTQSPRVLREHLEEALCFRMITQ